MSDYNQPQSTLETLPEQARRLSSGTLATLTGKSRYDEIDPIRLEFMEFCEENSARFETWQPAWNAYIEAKAGTATPIFDFLVTGTCRKKGVEIFRGAFSLSVTAKDQRDAQRGAIHTLTNLGYYDFSIEKVEITRMVPDEA